MNRFRRMRANNQLRNLVRETHLNKSDFIYPLFVVEGKNKKNPVELTKADFMIFQYCPTAQSLHPHIIHHSVTQLNQRRRSATERLIRWIMQTDVKRCVKLPTTLRRTPIW